MNTAEIKFLTLTLRNFMSFGNNVTVFPLERPGTTFMVGKDLDNTADGEGGNGVGKTTIINALTYAVYDKPVSTISKDKLVNNINKKHMEVVVTFIAPDGHTYTIKRTRKSKVGAAGNTVFLYKGDEDITLSSIANTNVEIERIIGIPYELFVRIIVFSAQQKPFLDLPVKSPTQANQTDVIEELFGLTELSAKAALLKEHSKETDINIKMCVVKLEALEGEHGRHEDQIKSAKNRVIQWETQRTTSVTQFKTKLKRVASIDVDQQQKLHVELKTLDKELRTVLTEHKELSKSLQDNKRLHDKAKADLTHLHDKTCPYCFQQYADALIKIAETDAIMEASFESMNTTYEDLKLIDAAINDLESSQGKIKAGITVDDLDEVIQIRNETDNIQSKIEELEFAVNPYLDILDELEEIKLDKINYDEINKLKKEQEHQKFLMKLLTKKDSFVRKALLNKNIPYLNARLHHYLNNLGLPHKVEFTHEMTAAISHFGRELDFGNLSAGQKARVNIALSFAFRDVLESLHAKINICMLDEVLDVGLDNVGVRTAARLLKQKAREEKISLYIISHRDEIDSVFDNKIVIELSKGFSYITED